MLQNYKLFKLVFYIVLIYIDGNDWYNFKFSNTKTYSLKNI